MESLVVLDKKFSSLDDVDVATVLDKMVTEEDCVVPSAEFMREVQILVDKIEAEINKSLFSKLLYTYGPWIHYIYDFYAPNILKSLFNKMWDMYEKAKKR
jgi:hypothetical protein